MSARRLDAGAVANHASSLNVQACFMAALRTGCAVKIVGSALHAGSAQKDDKPVYEVLRVFYQVIERVRADLLCFYGIGGLVAGAKIGVGRNAAKQFVIELRPIDLETVLLNVGKFVH